MRQSRLYSLCYEIKVEGKRTENVWLAAHGMSLSNARRHWQSALLTGTFAGFSMALKPMPQNLNAEQVSKNRDQWLEVIKTHRLKGTTEQTAVTR